MRAILHLFLFILLTFRISRCQFIAFGIYRTSGMMGCHLQALALILALAAPNLCSAGPPIRGLDPALLPRYDPSPDGKFACLNGKKSVPFEQVRLILFADDLDNNEGMRQWLGRACGGTPNPTSTASVSLYLFSSLAGQ